MIPSVSLWSGPVPGVLCLNGCQQPAQPSIEMYAVKDQREKHVHIVSNPQVFIKKRKINGASQYCSHLVTFVLFLNIFPSTDAQVEPTAH